METAAGKNRKSTGPAILTISLTGKILYSRQKWQTTWDSYFHAVDPKNQFTCSC